MKEQQIAPVFTAADKKIKTLQQKPDCLKQEKSPYATTTHQQTANGELRWALIAGRTLNMSLSHLVEPLRLFHLVRLSLTAMMPLGL